MSSVTQRKPVVQAAGAAPPASDCKPFLRSPYPSNHSGYINASGLPLYYRAFVYKLPNCH
ncbi:hypothetical protein EGM70_17235 [Enterobacteriaceae bacterium 89]|nr:hypothetical protein [Enterobacteriaceae bacterium 89]